MTRLLALLLLFFVPFASKAADPFYVDLLEQGERAHQRGDLDKALLDLEIACFGLLDDPELLIEGLVHLALARQSAGIERSVSPTLDRILLVEERFTVYSASGLDEDTRGQFEDLLYGRPELDRALSLGAFAHLAERRFRDQLAAAPADRKRELLSQRIEAQPNDPQWPRRLAELEMAQGRPAAALQYLETVLDLDPDDPAARCRRFEAAVAARECELALRDLQACPEDASTPEIAGPLLECLVDGQYWEQAEAYAETLPAQTLAVSPIRKLQRRIDKARREERERPEERGQVPADEPPAAPSEEALQPAESSPPAVASLAKPLGDEAGDNPAATAAAPQRESNPATAGQAESDDPCLDFRRAAQRERCTVVHDSLDSCLAATKDIQVARPVLRCLIELRDWPAAMEVLDALPSYVRSNRKIQKLERRVETEVPSPESGPIPEDPGTGGLSDDLSGESSGEAAAEALPALRSGNTAPSALPAGESVLDTVTALRQQLAATQRADELTEILGESVTLARRHPDVAEAQFLAAETAYRAGQWSAAVAFFEAGGDPGDDRPLLLFYYAISLYEIDRAVEAERLLERALPRLRKTSFVETYARRIRQAAQR